MQTYDPTRPTPAEPIPADPRTILEEFYRRQNSDEPVHIMTGRDDNNLIYLRVSRPLPALIMDLDKARELVRALGVEIANGTKEVRQKNQAALKAKPEKGRKKKTRRVPVEETP